MNTNDIKTPEILIQHGYSYRSLIGEGSNGKTYQAINLKTGEIVAIKALKFSDNLKNYELFKREAETLQAINSPGVPHFYEFITGETEFTECWIVQEFINGKSLGELIEDRKNSVAFFSVKETIELIYKVAGIIRMLEHDYVPPIIHRDIKPSNILVREDKTICLIDFGAVANPQKRCNQSTVAGTVGYMAPEQLLGNCAIQSDYYALGATALHMLTGIMPSDFPSDGFQIQFEKTLKESIPDIPSELVQFLKSMLSPNISDRPQNADILIENLNNLIDSLNHNIIANNKEVQKLIEKRSKINSNAIFNNFLLKFFIIFMILCSGLIYVLTNFSFDPSYKPIIFLCFPILIFPAYLIAKLFMPKLKKITALEEKLDRHNFIKIKKILPNNQDKSNIDNYIQEKGNITDGMIAAVYGNIIEYCYMAKNKARCSSREITEQMRTNAQKNGIKLEVGEIVKVQYEFYRTNDSTRRLRSHLLI